MLKYVRVDDPLDAAADDGSSAPMSLPSPLRISSNPNRHDLPDDAQLLRCRVTHTPSPAPVVLVVDDDDDCRELAMRALTKAGFRCVTLPSGRDAISVLGTGLRPATIVLDLQMPHVSGWDVWDWLQGSVAHAQIPVIFWTASGLSNGAISSAKIVAKGELASVVAAVEAATGSESSIALPRPTTPTTAGSS